MKRFNRCVVLLLFAVVSFSGVLSAEEPYKIFHKYMGDLKGWEAETPSGMNMDMGGMKMLVASRTYSQSDKELAASVMIGGATMMAMKMGEMSIEADGVSMKTQKIDGFQVIINYDSEERGGVVVVNLCKNEANSAIFMCACDGVKKGEILDLAKKFDWKAMAKSAKEHL